MTDILQEIVKNKEDFILKILQILEGKETKANVNLDGVEFKFGNSKVKVNGKIEFAIIPFDKKK